MAFTSTEKNQEILSLALEDRSSGYQDLVSNSNPLLNVLQRKNNWKTYSGPRIRERVIYNETGSAMWYSGYDFLNAVPAELFSDAEWTPKQAAVAVVLSNDLILNNDGENQLLDMMEAHIDAAERELQDEIDLSLHGNGTRFGGKELGGLQLAIPTVTNSGTYGGISRVDQAGWRTTTYDAHSFYSGYTQVNSTSVRPMLNYIMSARSRGRVGPDLLLMSAEHYAAYDAATVAIQRINDETGLGKLGFTSLKYYGAGRQAEIVQVSGIGNNMPANTTYLICTDHMRMRYHSERNFSKIGGVRAPINQDAVVQYIGFMGELTMISPLHMAKLYDSTPGS